MDKIILLVSYFLPILCLIIGFTCDTYTNGLYKVYGFKTKKHLYGFVTYSPNHVYKRGEWIKSTIYHTPNHREPQWYKW